MDNHIPSDVLQGQFMAATNQATMFRLGQRTQLQLTGKDRQKYLHNFCTNEIRNLQPGQSCEAFVTTIQGKIKAHIFVFAGEDSLWIDAVPGYEDLLFAHLDKYLITEDVEFHRRSAEFTEFYITGPKALSRLSNAQGRVNWPVGDLKVHQHRTLDNSSYSVRRVDWFGSTGCLVNVPVNEAEELELFLTAEGKCSFGDRAVYDACRILALFPEHGIDLTEDNLAQEAARTSSAISFTKGCYLGQEPIARIDSMGHVNQELRGLRLTHGEIPMGGSKVLLPNEVREAGVITSASRDFSTGEPIALAMLKRNYLSPGTKLTVMVGDQEVPATVFGPS